MEVISSSSPTQTTAGYYHFSDRPKRPGEHTLTEKTYHWSMTGKVHHWKNHNHGQFASSKMYGHACGIHKCRN